MTRIAELNFSHVGRKPPFAEHLARLNLFTRSEDGTPVVSGDLGELRVSFAALRTTAWLDIEDIATLAVVIRRVAEAGRRVEITLSKKKEGRLSRVHDVLDRLGFHEAFISSPTEESWRDNVKFFGERSHISQIYNIGVETTSYLQMQWLTKEDFDFDGAADIWRQKPHVQETIAKQFRAVLHAQGFAGTEIIETLTDTMFLELGWNIVLHAEHRAGSGIGIFCAQILHRTDPQKNQTTPEITFCVADAGRGIPSALRKIYRQQQDPNRKYDTVYGVTENAAILRFALDPDSTSRPTFPSGLDREGFRGLAHVATAIGDAGQMHIRSDGGAVDLKGTSEGTVATPKDLFLGSPIIGTQIVGTLRKRVPVVVIPSQTRRPELPKLRVEVVCNPDGSCPAIATAESAAEYSEKLRPSNETVVFDIGYGCLSIRELEYLCKNVARRFNRCPLIFWNVNPGWSEFGEIEHWFSAATAELTHPLLFIRALGDARLLGRTANAVPNYDAWWQNLIESTAAAKTPQLTSVNISVREFARITHEANSHFLLNGFQSASLSSTQESRNVDSGFYSGTIHLLKAETVSHFFSLLKNLSAGPRIANLKRWTEAVVGGVSRLQEETHAPESQLVLLGFTGTVRELVNRLVLRLQWNCRAYVLLTYDIATREELETVINNGDQVLFITDVILKGSLISAMHDLITRVGGDVIGVVSLVDRRQETTQAEGSVPVGREHKHNIPHISCGQFPKSEVLPEATDREYWVDPVSLVPSRQDPWSLTAEVDEKVEKTLQVIRKADAALCGHIVDGARHTSVYIRTKKLIETNPIEVRDQINDVLNERVIVRGWYGFKPSAVFFPSGISRIESVGLIQGRSVTVYETAVKSYVEVLKRTWPTVEPLEVARAFDPGGNARCARSVDLPTALRVENTDVIIADDGIWRGDTASSLVQIALSHGAKRILVAPLLARLSPLEVSQLEAQYSVWNDTRQSAVEVCYAFPLLLPIPYYGAQECPFDTSISRLKERAQRMPRELAEIADEAIDRLRGHSPTNCPVHTPAFSSAWVRLRVLVELASVQRRALEVLRKFVETTTAPDALLALFSLFFEEWRLIGLARLRQEVTQPLLMRARQVAIASETRSDVRMAALTLLRTQFREEFIDMLPKLIDTVLNDIPVLRLVVMHVAALNIDLRRRDNCIRFLEAVSERHLPALLEKAGIPSPSSVAGLKLATISKYIAMELRDEARDINRTPRECAVELYNLLLSNRASIHAVRSFLNFFAVAAESIDELTEKNFQLFAKEWAVSHVPFLADHILPLVNQIRRLLLRTATAGRELIMEEFQFLRPNTNTLTMDVASLSEYLTWLERSSRLAMFRGPLINAAGRLWRNLIAPDSMTVRLLENLRSTTVSQLITQFQARVEAQFAGLNYPVMVKVNNKDVIDGGAVLFAPADVVEACVGNVVDNLRRYAFERPKLDGVTVDRLVAVEVLELRSEKNEPMIELLIRNNGAPVKADVEMGHGGLHANVELNIFGGRYERPVNISEQPWRVLQRILFLIW